MAECIDCRRRLGRDEEAYSLCTPEGFGCVCVTCGAGYASEEAVFARLRAYVALGAVGPRTAVAKEPAPMRVAR